MIFSIGQLNKRLRRATGVGRILLSLTVVMATVNAYALQDGAATSDLPQSTLGHIVSPTYIEKPSSTPNALNQENGQRIGGLNTHISSALGQSQVDFSGGLFFSATTAPQQTSSATQSSMAFGQAAGNNALGLAGNLLAPGGNPDGKSDQAIFQQINVKRGGLNFSGSYADVGKEFQGFSDLTKQMNASDSRLMALGMTQSSYAMNYTGMKGLALTSSRSTVDNNQTGNAERGLTRSIQKNGMSLALGQQQTLEYSIQNIQEDWDPSVVQKDSRNQQKQQVKLSGALGQKSKFSLGQSFSTTTTGANETEDIRQQDLSLQWNEWKNLSLAGGYTNKLNGLTGEANSILNMELKSMLSPRLQLTGKLVENTTEKPDATQAVENNLLDLHLTSTLAHNLLFTSGYKDTTTADKGTVASRDQQVTWNPSTNWKMVSHLVNTDSEKDGQSSLLEHTVTGQLGDKTRSEQLSLYLRDETLPNDALQQRNEVVYTRALGNKSPAKLLVQAGDYGQNTGTETRDGSLLAVQVLGLQLNPRTTLALGYYTGPQLGAGYLKYRTWGQHTAGNLGVWGAQDFADYTEIGGEITHSLAKNTKLSLKQFRGQITDSGATEMVEYGVEQRFGTTLFQGSQVYTATPGKGSPITDVYNQWKLTMPGAKPLPAWTASAMRPSTFQDGTKWGFGILPTWSVTKPISGLTLEKREVPVNGKPANQYTLRAAGMLSDRCFLFGSFEKNPVNASNASQFDALTRSLFHVSYQVRPAIQLFARYTDEGRTDHTSQQYTYSYGVIGNLSKIERLQFQLDAQTRNDGSKTLSGNTYALEYERTVRADDSLTLKLQMKPQVFSSDKDRILAEASYNHTF